ncbi:hypothetical protein ACOME3_009808 [Neoechinorhynchus agilis]
MCQLVPFTSNVPLNVNIYTFVVDAIERYDAITNCRAPRLNKKTSIRIFVLIWIISGLCSVPYLFYSVNSVLATTQTSNGLNCTVQVKKCLPPNNEFFTKTYPSIMMIVQYIFPVPIITYAYVCSVLYIIRSHVPNQSALIIQFRKQQRKRIKVIKMFLIIVTVFCGSWFPLQLYNFLSICCPRVNEYKNIIQLFLVANWFAMSTSCYNPFIYSFCNKRFRSHLVRLVRRLRQMFIFWNKLDYPKLKIYRHVLRKTKI